MFPRLLRSARRRGASNERASDRLEAILDASKAPKRILFVEDDDQFRELFARLIGEDFDLELDSANTTDDARAKLNAAHYDAILLDVRVTNGDGVFLYEWVAKRWPSIEVVFLTGYDSTELRHRIERVGPARVFSKDRMLDRGFLARLFEVLGVLPRTT